MVSKATNSAWRTNAKVPAAFAVKPPPRQSMTLDDIYPDNRQGVVIRYVAPAPVQSDEERAERRRRELYSR